MVSASPTREVITPALGSQLIFSPLNIQLERLKVVSKKARDWLDRLESRDPPVPELGPTAREIQAIDREIARLSREVEEIEREEAALEARMSPEELEAHREAKAREAAALDERLEGLDSDARIELLRAEIAEELGTGWIDNPGGGSVGSPM